MDGIVSSWSSEDYDKKNIELCVKEIQEEFGQQFSNSKSILEQHTHTMTIHESELPDGVVFVESKADIQKVVKICKKYKCKQRLSVYNSEEYCNVHHIEFLDL